MTQLFISSGHSNKKNNGAIVAGFYESDINMAIRNEVRKILPAVYLNDNLSLKEKIDFINKNATSDDLAIEIHCNVNTSQLRRGTEAYYTTDPRIAEIFSRCVSQKLSIPNLGAKHDSTTWVGSLGFLRQVKCRSVLVELAYLTNLLDRQIIISADGQRKAAEGLIEAINEVGQPIPTPQPAETNWKGVFDALRKVLSWEEIMAFIKKYFAIIPRPV